jgi:mannose-6-phosphate isomerase-like protein (cupin superfamily)
MFSQTVAGSPENRRGNGQVSHLLLAPGQFGSRHLAVTWVEAGPGSQQPLHAHPQSEQVYVVIAGRGRMIVSGEEQEVRAGTLVFVPPAAEHAIYNPGPEQLVYASAAAPPFEPPSGEFAYAPQGQTEPPFCAASARRAEGRR